MKKLFTTLLRELEANRAAVLCAIVASHGSTPRGAGARMLVLEDGRTLGTIGGGAVEYRATRLAGELLAEKASRFETYRLSAGEVADVGMICGGDVRVYFQYVDPADAAAREVLADALELLDGGHASWLVTEIAGGRWRMGTCDRENGLRGLEIPPARLEPLLGSRPLLDEGETVLCAEPLTRAGTVYLVGAGHVARELAPILAMADFRVSVYDQREQAVSKERFPEAAELRCGSFPEALSRLPPLTDEDYVVIMTPAIRRTTRSSPRPCAPPPDTSAVSAAGKRWPPPGSACWPTALRTGRSAGCTRPSACPSAARRRRRWRCPWPPSSSPAGPDGWRRSREPPGGGAGSVGVQGHGPALLPGPGRGAPDPGGAVQPHGDAPGHGPRPAGRHAAQRRGGAVPGGRQIPAGHPPV